MMYRPFTLVVPYYDNAGMFREQQRLWRELPQDVREALHVIVVDDGSPQKPAKPEIDGAITPMLASFRVFRTGVDVRWNWLFCRNLGVEKAKTDWVLMTDMDHVVPATTWRRLMRDRLDQLCAYRLSRVTAPTNETCHPHPNTWVMTRHMFINRVGGYDERFSGVYGSDGEFHGRVALWAREIVMLPEVNVVYSEKVIPDACTTTYERKTPEDRERRSLLLADKLVGGASYQPRRLSFPWSQVHP